MPRISVERATLESEERDHARWERAQAIYRTRQSTSQLLSRCGSCGEWNDSRRHRCRVCGCERAA